MMSDSGKAVFLSYASQDAEAAKRICDSLRQAGIEVWFDQSELVGGDAWDAKIRRQIAECALFVPVISANTQARREGYFRIEWRLAAQRTHAMSDDTPFLLPVVIDDTRDAEAKVPAEFKAVQWVRFHSAGLAGQARLADGDTLVKFCARVKALLEGAELETQRAHPTERGEGVASPAAEVVGQRQRRRFGLRRWIALGVVALAGVASYLAWRPTRDRARETPAKADAAEIAPAPDTPARALAAKARLLFEQPDNTRDDLVLAEDYCKQALKLDDNDVEVWATYAELSSQFIGGRADTSLERRELARFQAERAMKLAPTSVAARFAKAAYLRQMHDDPTAQAEAERLLRQLAQERPDEPRVLNALGKTIGFSSPERAKEALAVLARAAAIPAGRAEALSETGWILYNLNRFTEAEVAIDASLADQPSRAALLVKVNLTLERGALAEAQAALGKIPAETMRSDAGVALATRVWMISRQPEKVLEILSGVTSDYLSSNTGGQVPVDLLRGLAYRLQGKTQAAQTAWSAALRLVDKRLEDQPRHTALLGNRAYLLALLGRREEATATMRLLEEIQVSTLSDRNNQISRIAVWALIEPPEHAIARLEAVLKGGKSGMLRIDPRFDLLRGYPRFEALVAEAPKPAAAASSAPDAKSVAVLAFTDESAAHDSEYFSDGMSDELIDALGRVPGLKVTARTSSFYFKGRNVPVPELARQLGVAYVVEGSVQRAGERVKIGARLTQAADGFQVWSDSFVRDAKDVFAVEDEIAGLIAKNLALHLGTSSAAATASVNPRAFELYVQARQAWNLRTPAGYDRAEAWLNEALALEPNFARAHAALADVWETRGQETLKLAAFGARDSSLQRKIGAEIERALQLNPESAEAYASLGGALWCAWKLPEGETALRRAIALNPSYASAHQWLGRVLLAEGRMDEALAALKAATELDPLSSRIADNYAAAMFDAGRFQESLTLYNRALAIQPGALQATWNKAKVLHALGRQDEAVSIVRGIANSEWSTLFGHVRALASVGMRSEAAALLPGVEPGANDRAYLLALLGRYEEALAALNPDAAQSVEIGHWLFNPAFDRMRADPRFAKFLATLGLTEAHARAQAWRAAHPPVKPEAAK